MSTQSFDATQNHADETDPSAPTHGFVGQKLVAVGGSIGMRRQTAGAA